MTLGIDGIISGLDTTSLINSLIASESREKTLLSDKASTVSKLVSSFQSLNTQLAALTDASKSAALATTWNTYRAASSSPSVTATASTGAVTSSLSFTVDALATSQVNLIRAADLAGQSSLTVAADGTATAVTIDGDDPRSVVESLNAARTGVSASLVRVGGSADAPEYRIQLTGATGAGNSFTVHAGADTGGTVLASADTLDADGAVVSAGVGLIAGAQDARLTLWGGTSAEHAVSSSSNAFSDVLAGTTITVSALSADPVTVTVTPDNDARAALVTGLVDQVSAVLSAISSGTATTTSTAADGSTVVVGGLYAGDSAVRALSQDLIQAFTRPVGGVSPATVLGISVSRDGVISVDQDVLAASLASDPEGTLAFAQSLSARIQTVGASYSDPISGLITTKITGQQSIYSDLQQRIGDWDTRIAARTATLQAKFTAMESTLQSLKTTSSWLETQLGSLMTDYSGSST